jgi:hypothetical protein
MKIPQYHGQNLDDILPLVDFVVEANNNEKHHWWKDFNKDHPLEQIMFGFGVNVGTVNNLPVFLELSFYHVYDKLVMFYNPCSRMVDWDMVDEWITALLHKNYPEYKGKYPKLDYGCDANNDHQIVKFCKPK